MEEAAGAGGAITGEVAVVTCTTCAGGSVFGALPSEDASDVADEPSAELPPCFLPADLWVDLAADDSVAFGTTVRSGALLSGVG